MRTTCQSVTAHVWSRALGKLLRRRSFASLLALASLLGGWCASAQGVAQLIPATEYQALVDLYNATAGTNWVWQDGWLDPHATSWYGVYLNETGHVQSLSLARNRLTGTIPASLTNLNQLKSLALEQNQLGGVIPDGLGNLGQLRYVTLNQNLLTGEIPSDLGRLTGLELLALFGNRLSGDVPNFTGFTNVWFRFYDNPLNFTPGSQSFANIHAMMAAGNRVDPGFQALVLPAEYQALVDFYQATGGTNWNNQGGWLDPAAQYWNDIGVDAEGHVTDFSVERNNLTGPIPEILTNFPQLKSLLLSVNHLTGGIPPSLGRLTRLQWVRLSGNELDGSIPATLGQLPQLAELDLNYNQLTGEIPDALGALTHLAHLGLSHNQLTGDVPNFTGFTNAWIELNANPLNLAQGSPSLANIQSMIAAGNSISIGFRGQIPPAEYQALLDLSDLAGGISLPGWPDPEAPNWVGVSTTHGHVTGLTIQSKELNGNIPASITNLTGLQTLDLSYNRLNGSIPASLGALTQLQTLNLSHNELTGTIPAELGSLNQLWALNLSNNRLEGPIPPVLGEMAQLHGLNLSYNALSGGIPESLGNFSPNSRIDLSHNQLAGEVPSFSKFDHCALNLEFNRLDLASAVSRAHLRAIPLLNQVTVGLEGSLAPADYQALRDLFQATDGPHWYRKAGWIDLQSPILEGVYCEGDRVITLSLSFNNLQGTLPDSLGNLTALKKADFSVNGLVGNLPASLGKLTQLQSLNLSRNPLEGDVPYYKGFSHVALDLTLTQVNLDPGSASRSNLDAMISAGNPIVAGMQLAIPPAEYQALLDLYNATDGPHWNNASSSHWPNPHDPDWDGVQVQGRHVVELSPPGGLRGLLPSSLGDLRQLLSLALGSNLIEGSLPESLTNLVNLNTVMLAGTHLEGNLPLGWTNLTRLELQGSRFTSEIFTRIAEMRRLSYLDFSFSQLDGGIPESLGQLSLLQHLDLSGNQLQGSIPESLGQLGQLHELILAGNRLEGTLPVSLGNLTNLYRLNLSANQLGGPIPDSFGQLARIGWLDLSTNQLTGPIPAVLGGLPYLQELRLQYNQLTGEIPASLATHAAPDHFYLLLVDHNHLGGDLPVFTSFDHSVYIAYNDFDFTPGSPAQTHLLASIDAGNFMVFAPQVARGAPSVEIHVVDGVPVLTWPLESAGYLPEIRQTWGDDDAWIQAADPGVLYSWFNRRDWQFELTPFSFYQQFFFRLRQP